MYTHWAAEYDFFFLLHAVRPALLYILLHFLNHLALQCSPKGMLFFFLLLTAINVLPCGNWN